MFENKSAGCGDKSGTEARESKLRAGLEESRFDLSVMRTVSLCERLKSSRMRLAGVVAAAKKVGRKT